MRLLMKCVIQCAALALMAAPLPAHANTSLQLADVARLARHRSVTVLEARAQVREVTASRAGATPWLGLNPSVSGGAGAVARLDQSWLRGGLGGAGTFQVSIPVEVAGQRSLRVKAVDAAARTRTAAVADAEHRAAAEACGLFLEALHAQAQVGLAQDAVTMAERTHAATLHRARLESASGLDVELASLDVADARRALALAEGRAMAGRMLLVAGLGVENQQDVTLAGPLRRADPPVPLPQALSRAGLRADVLTAQLGSKEAESRAWLAGADAIPSPTFSTMYQYWNGEHALLGTVSVPLPVFARGQGESAAARSRASALATEAQVRRQRAEAEVRAAHALVEALRAQHSAMEQSPDGQGQGLLTRLEEHYRSRRVDLTTLQATRRRVLQAQREGLELDFQEAQARLWLDTAMGVLP